MFEIQYMIQNKKRLVVMSLILLVLGIVAIIILSRINKSLQVEKSGSAQNEDYDIIIASVEKPFFVDLTVNISTGYQWQANFDTELLTLNKVSFKQQIEGNQVGQEQIQLFEFQPLTKAETSIIFQYVKPWEADTPPVNTKTYKITIK